jgi:hypothetical protein
MKLLTILAIALIAGVAFADGQLAAGNCTTLQIFNESANLSDNSTLPYYNQTWCAENATIVQECNATNATLIANSTGTFNNATVTCLENSSINRTVYVHDTVNNTVNACNFTDTITPTGSDQVRANVSGLSITIKAIPSTYCYENVNQNLSGLQLYRSDKCNTTVVCQPTVVNQTVVQTCPACPTCQSCLTYQYATPCPVPPGQECPACPIYSTLATQPDNGTEENGTKRVCLNVPIASASGEEARLLLRNDGAGWYDLKTSQYTSSITSLNGQISSLSGDLAKEKKAHADDLNTTSNIDEKVQKKFNDTFAFPAVLLVVIGCAALIAYIAVWLFVGWMDGKRVSAAEEPPATPHKLIDEFKEAGKGYAMTLESVEKHEV